MRGSPKYPGRLTPSSNRTGSLDPCPDPWLGAAFCSSFVGKKERVGSLYFLKNKNKTHVGLFPMQSCTSLSSGAASLRCPTTSSSEDGEDSSVGSFSLISSIPSSSCRMTLWFHPKLPFMQTPLGFEEKFLNFFFSLGGWSLLKRVSFHFLSPGTFPS